MTVTSDLSASRRPPEAIHEKQRETTHLKNVRHKNEVKEKNSFFSSPIELRLIAN
jgi:hypothetical protein